MARPLRIEFAGALYHVTSRGDRREEIFLDSDDRESFLELLGQVCGPLILPNRKLKNEHGKVTQPEREKRLLVSNRKTR
jgi:hypothetical protein